MFAWSANDWSAISQTIFNLVASVAVFAAAYKYVFLSGGPRRHTELDLKANIIRLNDQTQLTELQIRIDNKGIQLLEIFNIFVNVRALSASANATDWAWSSGNLVTVDDEKIWLHSNTGINMTVAFEVPTDVSTLAIELVVPYVQKRLPRSLNSIETSKVSDYNALERIFSTAE